MLAWGGRPTEGENKWSWGLIPTKASDLTDVWLWWMVAARVGREMAPRGVLLPCQMASPRKRSQRYQMPFVFNIFQPNLPCDKQNIKHNTCKEVIKFIFNRMFGLALWLETLSMTLHLIQNNVLHWKLFQNCQQLFTIVFSLPCRPLQYRPSEKELKDFGRLLLIGQYVNILPARAHSSLFTFDIIFNFFSL